MKILFLYDFPLWGSGSATYLKNTIEELLKFNHKVGILCPEDRRFLEDKIKHYKVTLSQIPVFVGHPELKGAKRYSELSVREITEIYKSYLDALVEAVENFQPDIIHVHHFSLISWVARYIYALKKIKYIITSHGSCLYDITVTDRRYMALSSDALSKAKAITLISTDTRTKLLKSFKGLYDINPGLRKNIKIITGGVNMNNFPEKVDTNYLDEKFNIKGKQVVLFTGRLISQKGIEYLVKAAKNINGEVIIVGDGPMKEKLSELVSQLNLKNVHIVGYLFGKELIDFYYRADVFVAPFVLDEPLGLAILEAMAARTPVVTTKKGGIPLLVKDGYNGFFVKPRNSNEIASICNKLFSDENLRRKIGENARKTVSEKFTWKKTALKFHHLYESIYKNGKSK